MKNIYIGALAFLSLFVGLSSCSDDDDNEMIPVPEEVVYPELKFSTTDVDIEVGKESTVDITGGGEEYSVFSSNPEIITATLTDKKIVLSAVEKGNCSVVVTDANGKISEIKALGFYSSIVFSETKVILDPRLGESKTFYIPVAQGNGDYIVEAESDLVNVSSSGEMIIVEALSEGTTTLTITDSYNVSTTLEIEVVPTIVPYTDEELEELKNDNSQRYICPAGNFNNSAFSGFYHNGIVDNGKTLFGFNYYGSYIVDIKFKEDSSVGVKTEGEIKFMWGGSIYYESNNVDIEIIKNNGTQVWGIFSYVENGSLIYGNFCSYL